MDEPRRRAPDEISYPAELPIAQRRDELLAAIRDHQVVVIAGETGSGKSTQLPKFCLELGRGVDGWIGHTQPRRIAARAIAERVADELGTDLGTTVGYAVRFTDKVGPDTMVKVMTDGILLAEIQRDRMLRRYDTIIIDEAHERSLNIDFLLGYLKQLLPKRPDLKVIITSATIDTERFAAHFDNAPVVEVSGRTYPVEIRYRPWGEDPDGPTDQTEAVCDAATELATERDGDILVFCSGEREIRDTVDALDALSLPQTEVIPLFARLSAAEQHRVFAPHRGRRIVVATNVAETSLTVPGIHSVIDTGTARISRYNRRTKVQRLPIEAVSQASANQRSGRCGRLGPGVAIRLYSEDDFAERPEFTDPEIQRTNLASVILQMAAIGLGKVERFPFVDPPDHRSIRDGITLLDELGAVDPEREGQKKWLTPVGRQLARLPVDPRMGRMLLAGADHGCLAEILVITAGLSIQDPRERPDGKEQAAAELHARFRDDRSDFLSLLHLWGYLSDERSAGSSSRFRRLCKREFLHYPRIREWQDLHAQLRRAVKDMRLSINRDPAEPDDIHQALLHGLLSQVGAKQPDHFDYRGARNAVFAIAPGSTLFKRGPRWVMAAELVETNRMWARTVAPVRPEWLERIGAHLLKRTHTDLWWEPERASAVTHETVSLLGLVLASNRTVTWDQIDPDEAHDQFLFHALARGAWTREHEFVSHNAQVIDEARALETRLRKDVVLDANALADWFAERVPPTVTSGRTFDRWWKNRRKKTPELLHFTLDDVLIRHAADLDDGAFPELWRVGDHDIPLAYANDPTTSWDGVTIDLPIELLDEVDDTTFEWQVPGFRRELVEALIRSLPKGTRKAFVPIPETVDEVMEELDPIAGRLPRVLADALSRRGRVEVDPNAFDREKLPNHLRPSYRLIGSRDEIVAEGNDIAALQSLLRDELRATLENRAHDIEQGGLTTWSVGTIPNVVRADGPGRTVDAFPALVDDGDTVALRLMATAGEQADAMWLGVRRLVLLNRPSMSKTLRALLTDDVKLALMAGPYASPKDWFDDVLTAAVDEVMLDHGSLPWDAIAFDALLTQVRTRLPALVELYGHAAAGVMIDRRNAMRAVDALPAQFDANAADLYEQLGRLVYPGFVTGFGGDRLADIRRYLQGIEHRAGRVAEAPRRDTEAMLRVRALEADFDRIALEQSFTLEVEKVFWMLQELRINLFAQPLGAKGPGERTSAVQRALDEAARSVSG